MTHPTLVRFQLAFKSVERILADVIATNISITRERDRLMLELTQARKERDDLRTSYKMALADIETLRRVSKQVRGYTPYKDAISPGVPKGYDTVLGFLAKYRSGVLDDIGDDWRNPRETLRDGMWCAARAKGKEIWVKACPAMKARGIEKLRAYPLEILKERFPE